MCDFISWIEKDNAVLFLTGDDVFHTKKGKELQKYCRNSRDLIGHGAIRHFFNLSANRGENRECTDFSAPENFPPEIVKAIKAGKMRGMGYSLALLTKPAQKTPARNFRAEKLQQLKEIDKTAPAKLRRIREKREGNWSSRQFNSEITLAESINAAFTWSETKEGQEYWSDINCEAQLLPVATDGFWDLFKVKKNRAQAWR